MDEQGKIISSCDIDENLALQIWTRGKTPRLSIFNKNKNQRKLIHIAWVEKRDRTLAINGRNRGETVSYVVQDFEEAIRKILTSYAANTNYKVKFFTVVVDLEKALHRPELVMSASDIAMMSEDKRSSLWVADCSGENKPLGVFKPFFPLSDSEAAVITPDKLKITSQTERGVEALIKTGIINDLKKINPERWHNPIRITAAAMLLGFSYCGGDGSKMADTLWTSGEKPKTALNTPIPVPAMKAPVKKLNLHEPGLMRLGHKLAAYIRHYYYIDDVMIDYVSESEKVLHEKGYDRQRRVDFNTGSLGDVPYRVTFFENESEGMTAFGCVPRMQTARHKGDMLIIVPTEIYKKALANNTMGGVEDDFFTITRLLWAKQFKDWYKNLIPYLKNITGLINA
ncbi:MAG: hypothetical protein IJP48_05225 [Synergistaceae bacterium]|nr:hypothetical protein [Synergistaceae bacterium]